MENGEQAPQAFCQRVQLTRLRQRYGERFIDNHMLPRFERRFRQREVGIIWRRNNNQVDIGIVKKFFRFRNDGHGWPVRMHF
ncbi:hypothetical protein D3C86_1751210 [compost metagenome]